MKGELTMTDCEHEIEVVNQRLGKVEQNMAVNSSRVGRIERDISPFASVPATLAELKAMINGLLKDQGRLESEIGQQRQRAGAESSKVEDRVMGVIKMYIYPLIMLVLGYLISKGNI
jgi:hypothetical protein